MSMNKKDIIIRLHRGNKTPEEIQSVINILFSEELGFATVKVLFFQKNHLILNLIKYNFSQLKMLSEDTIII